MASPKPRRAAGPPRGVLRAAATEDATGSAAEHRRVLPEPALAAHVAHFWWVRWALQSPAVTETLPHPSVHVVLEEGEAPRAEVVFVSRTRFVRRLEGEGRVFAIKFRPAAFPFLRGSAASVTDRVAPIEAVLGDEGAALARSVFDAPDFDAKIRVAESFLSGRLPHLPVEVAALRDAIERIATDASLLRVEDVASALAIDVRTLQRRFRQHVGVSPKWVIQRYRMHEAAERLKGASPPSLAALAAELGYADQAHFARDFKRAIGRTPRAFARAATVTSGAAKPFR